MTQREKDVECFYVLLRRLENRVGGKPLLKHFPSVISPSEKGVYFIFEPGEVRSDQTKDLRVVRVGTHGLTARSRSTIWTRLFEHLMANGRSVFRNYVNQALRERGGCDDESIGYNRSAFITRYIGRMPFLWAKVDGDDGHQKRKYIEQNAIALLSGRHFASPDIPSNCWLGKYSDKEPVRKSGLWNVNHTKSDYDCAFLSMLEVCVDRTNAFGKLGTDSPMCVSKGTA